LPALPTQARQDIDARVITGEKIVSDIVSARGPLRKG
jgi:hypothetical protein